MKSVKKEQILLTPYYQSEMVMIVRGDDASKNYTDIQQFSGKTIVGQMSTSYDTVIDQN